MSRIQGELCHPKVSGLSRNGPLNRILCQCSGPDSSTGGATAPASRRSGFDSRSGLNFSGFSFATAYIVQQSAKIINIKKGLIQLMVRVLEYVSVPWDKLITTSKSSLVKNLPHEVLKSVRCVGF